MYEGSKEAIRTPHGVTRKVDITVGVHQGSALSPFLFLLTLDSIVNHLEEGPLRTILYADDIALVADNQEELEEKGSDEDSPDPAEDERAAPEVVWTHPQKTRGSPHKALDFEAPRKRPRGAPRKTWKDVIKRDLAEVGATADDALDRMRWRQITRTADPATARD
ncbi:unnamed protein product [Heligmosomoides polygyrus]|uniref:Reverse transcriptase domain-containing protein n=1 Tax=Heligmosomoides polygyrus TaxID=6339 RepID=A0A183G5Y8_HELPZ|nr:unnamed protein product [Heligmosomoides polygyrus]